MSLLEDVTAQRHLFTWLAAALMSSGLGFTHGQLVNPPPTPHWIEFPEEAPGQPVFFRKSFAAQPPILKAILLGASKGRLAIHLNGEFAGQIEGQETAASLDLTPFVRAGENTLAVRAEHSTASPAFSLLLELNSDLSGQQWVISDATWVASTAVSGNWTEPGFHERDWRQVRSAGQVDGEVNPFDPSKAHDAYNSWKLALGSQTATDPATFTLIPGFRVELLHSAQAGEGSWVSMAFDPQGRLTLARESRGLLRLTLGPSRLERMEVIEDTLLECRGLLYAHGALYVNANNSKGFYRLRDTNGDDQFDEKKLLLATTGSVGHGRNQVVLGPDGSLWLVHGNNVEVGEAVSPGSPFRHYQNDTLIPCPFDDAMFDGDVLLPAGHLLRTGPEGETFELFAGGLRNPLAIAFNKHGEMFTFDADMEWDLGAPWYRPNRVNHIISGADFGWRRGTSKWPDYLPDTLPSTLDVGLASPTGVEFGTGSHFPEPYKQALFIADWAYGRILSAHLTPSGASYSGRSELFLSGRPLNVTDLTFGPDGAMYFITGGRRTQSGLYRVSHDGTAASTTEKTAEQLRVETQAEQARQLRRGLEAFHTGSRALSTDELVQFLWPCLGHEDPWIRHAARVALERQDWRRWQAMAFEETNIDVALTAWLALARTGPPEMQSPLFHALGQWSLAGLSPAQQLRLCRIYEIACARMGRPPVELAAAALRQLEAAYPVQDWRVNHRLCMLLVYFESPFVIEKSLELLAAAERSEDLMHYLFFLRYMREGWTFDQRQAWFRALGRAGQLPGGRDYYSVLKRISEEMLEPHSKSEREILEALIQPPRGRLADPVNQDLTFVREWRMEDFDFQQPLRGRSFERGKAAFASAQCFLCHRFGQEGSTLAPDLTAIASRFDRRALMESILEPSKVIDEKFLQTIFTLEDGSSITGQVDFEDAEKVLVRHGPFSEETIELTKLEIIQRELSPVSPMPSDLVNHLSEEQILDLLAFLESAGDPGHPVFKP
jgi:putative heme-binding domain-containing protein